MVQTLFSLHILSLFKIMESCIKQNNAIEIYEVSLAALDCFTEEIAQDYFNEVDEATDCEEPKAMTVNLYRLVFILFFRF